MIFSSERSGSEFFIYLLRNKPINVFCYCIIFTQVIKNVEILQYMNEHLHIVDVRLPKFSKISFLYFL